MLVIDDVLEGFAFGPQVGIGLAAVAVGAVVLGPRAKPLAKNAIKGYLALTQVARERMAEATEQLQDLVAEARYEYESGLRVDGATPKPAEQPA
jgi:hypothetical protein